MHSENHSLGEWFKRSLAAAMKKREEQIGLHFAGVSGSAQRRRVNATFKVGKTGEVPPEPPLPKGRWFWPLPKTGGVVR